uniref:RING-CH-type domain-containing protein n=1 Tax=Timema bartmani TaxID=61472 RepID=A0A7R9ETA7_9NEOP|nr:unnamed protein product [Timema bartmani]
MIYGLHSSHEFELVGGSLRDHNNSKGNIIQSRDPGGYDRSLSTLAIPPLPSVGSNYCRYCQTADESPEKLIMPCKCQGTMAFVHLTCLTRWLNSVGRTYCELCLTRYSVGVSVPRDGLKWVSGLDVKAWQVLTLCLRGGGFGVTFCGRGSGIGVRGREFGPGWCTLNHGPPQRYASLVAYPGLGTAGPTKWPTIWTPRKIPRGVLAIANEVAPKHQHSPGLTLTLGDQSVPTALEPRPSPLSDAGCGSTSCTVGQLVGLPNSALANFYRLEELVPPFVNAGRSLIVVTLVRRFKTETNRRFKLFESLVIWAQHPVNRIRVRTNLAIISLLAVFTGAMLTLGLMGMKHFINNDSPLSKTQIPIDVVIVVAAGINTLHPMRNGRGTGAFANQDNEILLQAAQTYANDLPGTPSELRGEIDLWQQRWKHKSKAECPSSAVWMNSVVVSFMGVIVLGFWISIYLIARDELGPWYNWWTHCVNWGYRNSWVISQDTNLGPPIVYDRQALDRQIISCCFSSPPPTTESRGLFPAGFILSRCGAAGKYNNESLSYGVLVVWKIPAVAASSSMMSRKVRLDGSSAGLISVGTQKVWMLRGWAMFMTYR